jgi:hypothetical protein
MVALSCDDPGMMIQGKKRRATCLHDGRWEQGDKLSRDQGLPQEKKERLLIPGVESKRAYHQMSRMAVSGTESICSSHPIDPSSTYAWFQLSGLGYNRLRGCRSLLAGSSYVLHN